MDIKATNKEKSDPKPILSAKPESDSNKRDTNKIWIIICPIILLAFIFFMAKMFIIDPLSLNEKPSFGKNSKSDVGINESVLSKNSGAQPTSTAAKTNPNPTNPNANSNSEPQAENPDQAATPETKTENNSEKTASPASSDKFITKSLIDVSKIKKISKFRSCADEAYGETSFQDQKEASSSLLNNIKLKDSSTPIYAPFDGEIIYSTSGKIALEVRPFNGWVMTISGVNLKSGLSLNSEVKSGDEIGTSSGISVKVTTSGFAKSQKEESYEKYSKQNLDSLFTHLSESVSKEFSDKGATSDAMAVAKSTRDTTKCSFKSTNDEDWITLK